MWEYKTALIKASFLDIEKILNDYGKDGWEVISMTETESPSIIINYYNILMKRKVR